MTPDIPRVLFYGTFFINGVVRGDHLEPGSNEGYVSTTTRYEVAEHFAIARGCRQKNSLGRLVVCTLDTTLFPDELRLEAIPPDGFIPAASQIEAALDFEKIMQPNRIRLEEWRFPRIPLASVIAQTEVPRQPDLTEADLFRTWRQL